MGAGKSGWVTHITQVEGHRGPKTPQIPEGFSWGIGKGIRTQRERNITASLQKNQKPIPRRKCGGPAKRKWVPHHGNFRQRSRCNRLKMYLWDGIKRAFGLIWWGELRRRRSQCNTPHPSIQPSCNFDYWLLLRRLFFFFFLQSKGWKTTQETIISLEIVLQKSNQEFFKILEEKSLKGLFPFPFHPLLWIARVLLLSCGFSETRLLSPGRRHALLSPISQSGPGSPWVRGRLGGQAGLILALPLPSYVTRRSALTL